MKLQTFTFNPFSENSYVIYDETLECAIIDPGCYNEQERQTLLDFIEKNQLSPQLLLNTHCHIDHVLGNQFVSNHFKLPLYAHELEKQVLAFAASSASMYQIPYTDSPPITHLLEAGKPISFGNTTLDIVFTPGHSPGSVSFLHSPTKTAIVGDVLFFDSIGRTDLPGGHHQTLLDSIRNELFVLEDDWTVYNGHGVSTTIGREKRYNPFFR